MIVLSYFKESVFIAEQSQGRLQKVKCSTVNINTTALIDLKIQRATKRIMSLVVVCYVT